MSKDNSHHSTLAHAIAPEDIREGDFVAVLAEVDELLPIGVLFECTPLNQPRSVEPVRIQWMPCGESVPLKVEAVCLPWVLVKAPLSPAARIYGFVDRHAPYTLLRTLDVRRYRLARLTPEYGRRVWRLLKQRAERSRHTDDDDHHGN